MVSTASSSSPSPGPAAQPAPAAQGLFRAVFGHFPTGVAVVTARGAHGPTGMTANALCSVSLDPLLLLVCLDRGARTLAHIERSGRFGVNVLAASQDELSRVFASKRPESEKFAGVAHRLEAGVPILEGALAWLACELDRLEPGGDHVIALGTPLAMGHRRGEPLIWYRGAYRALHGAEGG